ALESAEDPVPPPPGRTPARTRAGARTASARRHAGGEATRRDGRGTPGGGGALGAAPGSPRAAPGAGGGAARAPRGPPEARGRAPMPTKAATDRRIRTWTST